MAKTNETPRLICCFVLFNPPPPLQCWLAKLKHEMMVFFAIDKLTQRNYSQCNINIVRGKGGGLYCFRTTTSVSLTFCQDCSFYTSELITNELTFTRNKAARSIYS